MMGTTGKRRGILLVPGLLILLLAGCGPQKTPERATSSQMPAQNPAPPPASSADHRPVIAAFGDSLSAGHGAPIGDSYPDYLQKDLNAKGYAYRVVNLGISGNTTTDGIERIDSVLALKPAIVILELGGNDGLRGIPVADTRANLEQMIVVLRKAGIKVVLAGMTLPPNYGPAYIRPFQQTYVDLARRYHLTLIPFLLQGIVKRAKSEPGLMQQDGIHPTARGNRIVAATVMQYLQPLLRRNQPESPPARPGPGAPAAHTLPQTEHRAGQPRI